MDEQFETEADHTQKTASEAGQEQDEKQEEIESTDTISINGKPNGSKQSQEASTGSSDSEKKQQRTNNFDMKKAIQQTMSSVMAKNKVEIQIAPIWTPSDKRINAALIYLYFRSVRQMSNFIRFELKSLWCVEIFFFFAL